VLAGMERKRNIERERVGAWVEGINSFNARTKR
jgi:hypothetical protein